MSRFQASGKGCGDGLFVFFVSTVESRNEWKYSLKMADKNLMPDASQDREAVRRQLGRDPKPFAVSARCPFGLPSVIENEKSRSMPTTFWLTCPHLDTEIARIEAKGGVRRAQEEVGEDAVAKTHKEHLERFGVRVAGVREGGFIKCLHAFTALHLSGAAPNPVGEWTLARIEGAYPADGCCVRGEKAG